VSFGHPGSSPGLCVTFLKNSNVDFVLENLEKLDYIENNILTL